MYDIWWEELNYKYTHITIKIFSLSLKINASVHCYTLYISLIIIKIMLQFWLAQYKMSFGWVTFQWLSFPDVESTVTLLKNVFTHILADS